MQRLENQRTEIKWTPYLSTAYAEGFCEGDNATEEQQLEAWAYIYKNKLQLGLQGWFGRNLEQLLTRGLVTEDGEVGWDEYDNILEQYSYDN